MPEIVTVHQLSGYSEPVSTPDDPTLPFEIGELIADKYRVDRLLGAGGMGVVVAATHLDLDRPVAVKLIREELAADPTTVERLMLEARAAAKIKSEHVGRVLDVGKLPNGVPYIVMELLEGSDLCQLLEKNGALPIIDAVDMLLQACEAIAEAHHAHIVHRDLKPENLFVARFPDGSPNIKVLDFGISKQLGDPGRRALTNPSSAVGSPQYMAPEQMRAGAVDVRADIWALGAILYELLSNRQAFEGATIPEVCVKVMGQDPIELSEHVPHIPDALLAIVNRCLAKDREQRFSSVLELTERLAPFGSERAAQSRDRIRGVGSGTAAAAQPQHAGRPGSAPTAVATTPGGGLAVNVARTEHWTPQPSGNPNNDSPRSAARWPVFAGLSGVVVLGAGLWVFSRPPPPTAEDTLPVSGTQSANPRDWVPPEVPSQPAPDPGVVARNPDAGAPASAATAPTRAAETNAPSSVPRSNTTPRPVRPPKRSPAKSAAPATDAWDPDSFGGRR